MTVKPTTTPLSQQIFAYMLESTQQDIAREQNTMDQWRDYFASNPLRAMRDDIGLTVARWTIAKEALGYYTNEAIGTPMQRLACLIEEWGKQIVREASAGTWRSSSMEANRQNEYLLRARADRMEDAMRHQRSLQRADFDERTRPNLPAFYTVSANLMRMITPYGTYTVQRKTNHSNYWVYVNNTTSEQSSNCRNADDAMAAARTDLLNKMWTAQDKRA